MRWSRSCGVAGNGTFPGAGGGRSAGLGWIARIGRFRRAAEGVGQHGVDQVGQESDVCSYRGKGADGDFRGVRPCGGLGHDGLEVYLIVGGAGRREQVAEQGFLSSQCLAQPAGSGLFELLGHLGGDLPLGSGGGGHLQVQQGAEHDGEGGAGDDDDHVGAAGVRQECLVGGAGAQNPLAFAGREVLGAAETDPVSARDSGDLGQRSRSGAREELRVQQRSGGAAEAGGHEVGRGDAQRHEAEALHRYDHIERKLLLRLRYAGISQRNIRVRNRDPGAAGGQPRRVQNRLRRALVDADRRRRLAVQRVREHRVHVIVQPGSRFRLEAGGPPRTPARGHPVLARRDEGHRPHRCQLLLAHGSGNLVERGGGGSLLRGKGGSAQAYSIGVPAELGRHGGLHRLAGGGHPRLRIAFQRGPQPDAESERNRDPAENDDEREERRPRAGEPALALPRARHPSEF